MSSGLPSQCLMYFMRSHGGGGEMCCFRRRTKHTHGQKDMHPNDILHFGPCTPPPIPPHCLPTHLALQTAAVVKTNGCAPPWTQTMWW